jgi:hypothetical protein
MRKMRPYAPRAALAGILALVAGAAAILIAEGATNSMHAVHAQEFQQLVGGLGFGPAVDLSRCPNSFDPRLGGHCPEEVGPIPGGGCYCPHHACSIFYYAANGTPP